jgi:hypothetical protein
MAIPARSDSRGLIDRCNDHRSDTGFKPISLRRSVFQAALWLIPAIRERSRQHPPSEAVDRWVDSAKRAAPAPVRSASCR